MRFRVGWGGEWHTHYSFLLEKNFITKCSISQLKQNQPGLLRVCVQRLQSRLLSILGARMDIAITNLIIPENEAIRKRLVFLGGQSP